jgi:gliding motility-associated-like protein
MRKILFAAISLLLAGTVSAQTYAVDTTNQGQTYVYDPSVSMISVTDNDQGAGGRYMPGDNYLSIQGSCTAPAYFYLEINIIDIDPHDTLYIYDGPDIFSPVKAKINNNTGHTIGKRFFASPSNTSNTLTVRMNATASGVSAGGAGFILVTGCGTPCEQIIPVIESKFYRTRNGVIYDSSYVRDVPVYDTLWTIASNGDTLGFDRIDTSYFVGAHLCIGDGVIFKGHGNYGHEHGFYDATDATTTFTWDMNNEGDSLIDLGLTSIEYNDYQKTGCYDMSLSLTDIYGCISTEYVSVRVRTSANPIKTVFTIQDICNTSKRPVRMGYDGENATLVLRTIEAVNTVSKVYEVRTFIPDGKYCPVQCYQAPVQFTEFPSGRAIRSGTDVCSICINFEHTFLGDITASIICPSGQKAYLWFGNQDTTSREGKNVTDGAGAGGGSKYMGYPIEASYDGSSYCDSLQNPFGMGTDYCFSRNVDYTLVTGQTADAIVGKPAGGWYITSSGFMDNYNVTFPTLPTYFLNGGGTVPSGFNSNNHKRPSDHENKLDYYIPYAEFNELIGCSLNGIWQIELCDLWGSDNGWVFSWSMDICGVSQDDDCKYDVGIDSLVWRANNSPQYCDYDLGHYRGLVVERVDSTLSYLYSPDTAGTFPVDVFVYDEFGCVWDTNTSISTFWTPMPDLGPDTTLCGVDRAVLDATDRHSATRNYSYSWSPFGQNTPTIITEEEPGADINYIVEVKNTEAHVVCTTRDTILVRTRKQPLPNFAPVPFSLEGCAPMTITFDNQSIDADHHLWDFGDGITSEFASPTHTYAEGLYTLKYYATSDEGCIDSIVSENSIAVYPTPQAAFSWEPVYPSVLNPVTTFNNLTEPNTPGSKYFWEFQYDRDNPLSVETVTEFSPIFDFSKYASGDGSGNYGVSLIARTENIGPSGNLVRCSDTASNTILVINDFLQFPNVVTPNGDGINDKFEILNLIDGMAYPINSLDIYNKWGTRVFHKQNISSEADFWDPSDLPDGTYFYRFSARGYNGNIEHNGAIEVLH